MADEQNQCPAHMTREQALERADERKNGCVCRQCRADDILQAYADGLAAKSTCGEERTTFSEQVVILSRQLAEQIAENTRLREQLAAMTEARGRLAEAVIDTQAQLAAVTRERDVLKIGTAIEVLMKAEETQGRNFVEDFLRMMQRAEQAEAREAAAVKALEQAKTALSIAMSEGHEDPMILAAFRAAAAIVAQEAPKS